MALKSTSTPLVTIELSAWRTQICAYKGINYDDQNAAWKTMFNDTVNRAYEYLSQRAGHHPWGQQETTLSVAAGTDQTFEMPSAFRHLITIYEQAADGSRIVAAQSTKESFFNEQSGSAHPWTYGDTPVWFWDGMTDDQPAVQQWRRVGADNSGATAYVLYRPYFNLLTADGGTQDDWPYLPAAESSAILHRILSVIEAFDRNWEASAFHKGMMEEEIRALEVNDRTTVEAPMRLGVDPDFARQMG